MHGIQFTWQSLKWLIWTWLKSMNHVFSRLSAVHIRWLTITNFFFSGPNYTLMEIKSHTQALSKKIEWIYSNRSSYLLLRKDIVLKPWSDYKVLSRHVKFSHSWNPQPLTIYKLGSKAIIYQRNNTGQKEVNIIWKFEFWSFWQVEDF